MARQPASLGTRIRRARERKRMKRPELAAALGVSLKTIDNWENDRTNPRDSLGALGELLGEDFYKPEAESQAAIPPELADKPDMVEPVRRRYPDPRVQARVLEAMAAAIRGEPLPPTEPDATAQSPPAAREREAG